VGVERRWKMNTEFYRIVDDCLDGDEYGRVVAVVDGKPVAVYYWTSNPEDYCSKCGAFGHTLCDSYAPEHAFRLNGGIVKKLRPEQWLFWYYHYKWVTGLFAEPIE
jgi:hypothetical protein